jgi:hypothetical protein
MAGHVYPFAAAWGRRHVAVVVFGLLLSGCGGGQTWGPMTETDKNDLACNEYGFYPGSQQYDDCMKYVVSRRSQRPNFPAID